MGARIRASRIYEVDPWAVVERDPKPENTGRGAAVFAVANGIFGLRGGFEETPFEEFGAAWPAALIGGIYETEPIFYGESAFGFPTENQRSVLLANPVACSLSLDGHVMGTADGRYVEHSRHLDMRNGVLSRSVVWQSEQGKRLAVTFKRIACVDNPSLLLHRIEVEAPDGGEVRLTTALDGRQRPAVQTNDPRAATGSGEDLLTLSAGSDGDELLLDQRIRNSSFRVVMRARQMVTTAADYSHVCLHGTARAAEEFCWHAEPGGRFAVDRFIAIADGRRHDESSLETHTRQVVDQACAEGVDVLEARQAQSFQAFWQSADVEIDGDDALQQGFRFNLFHIYQSTGRDALFPIAAKGLSSDGYDGHVFWDGEIYVMPVLAHSAPELAKRLLQFRFATLGQARARARELAHDSGALYAWRTIDGRECSAYFPAGTAQYHINADIAYAVRMYWQVTGDDAFLACEGAEMVLETARIWRSTGHFNPRRGGAFCIDEVTGPDEYSALVNNNFFTNAMARRNLLFAVEVYDWLKTHDADAHAALVDRLGLTDAEIAGFREAAEAMCIAYDADKGVHLQDDGFLDKKPWDLENTPKDHFPLLLHYHPLVIYRHQVCKQPDVLLASYLLHEDFDRAQKRRDFEAYEPITTHDSTLSACVHGIIAAELGKADEAFAYFTETARLDLDDYHGNTHQGVHTAAMGGTWAGLVNGFAGLRNHGTRPVFRPQCPAQWGGYRFKVGFRGRRLAVAVTPEQATYTLEAGEPMEIGHGDTVFTVAVDEPVSHPILTTEALVEAAR